MKGATSVLLGVKGLKAFASTCKNVSFELQLVGAEEWGQSVNWGRNGPLPYTGPRPQEMRL